MTHNEFGGSYVTSSELLAALSPSSRTRQKDPGVEKQVDGDAREAQDESIERLFNVPKSTKRKWKSVNAFDSGQRLKRSKTIDHKVYDPLMASEAIVTMTARLDPGSL